MTKLLLGFMGVGKTTVAAQLDEHFWIWIGLLRLK